MYRIFVALFLFVFSYAYADKVPDLYGVLCPIAKYTNQHKFITSQNIRAAYQFKRRDLQLKIGETISLHQVIPRDRDTAVRRLLGEYGISSEDRKLVLTTILSEHRMGYVLRAGGSWTGMHYTVENGVLRSAGIKRIAGFPPVCMQTEKVSPIFDAVVEATRF